MNKILIPLATIGLATAGLANGPQPLTAPGPEGDLAGTLIPPEEGQPIVLIIPGSGPTDRDGNNPLGVRAASYKLLAEALADRGIGSVRIDKRGMFASNNAIPDPNNVTLADYAQDVRAWIAVTKAQTGAECIWVLGHSEGGLVALEAAQKVSDICGFLLVASVGRPLGTVIRQQLEANPANAPVLEEAFSAISKLEAGERVSTDGMHPELQGLFAPAVQGFLIDVMARDPGAMASKVTVPTLIIAGGKDLQTPIADAEALAAGKPDAELVVIPTMNHVLKSVDEDARVANLATYADASLPIHSGLVDAVVRFISPQAN